MVAFVTLLKVKLVFKFCFATHSDLVILYKYLDFIHKPFAFSLGIYHNPLPCVVETFELLYTDTWHLKPTGEQ